MKPQDATVFATGIGLEELKARFAVKGKDPNVGETDKDILDKFFNDQGHYFNNRDDDKILKAVNK